MPGLQHEGMSPVFDKWHVGGLPFAAVFHRFTAPDSGDPHDHPWAFRSFILKGGYREEVYDRDSGDVRICTHHAGESFHVPATHVHRIVELLAGECWTLILPEAHERQSCFWQFRGDGAYYRQWHASVWTKYEQST